MATNPFFDWASDATRRLQPGKLVRDDELNSALDAVTDGFDAVDVVQDRSLRAPAGETLNDLPTSANRASKALAFDANGQPIASSIATSGEMDAAVQAAIDAQAAADAADAARDEVVSLGFKAMTRSAVSGNTTIGAADFCKWFDITSSPTMTFAAPATLGAGWWCVTQNTGTGDVTYSHTSGNIDGLTSYVGYPREARLWQCDGSTIRSIVLAPFFAQKTTSFTFTKPPGYSAFDGLAWSGGASGARSGSAIRGAAGGGGGGCLPFHLLASAVGATETVTIAGEASAVTTAANGNAGGATSFGSLFSVGGGAAGTAAGSDSTNGTFGAGGSPTGATTNNHTGGLLGMSTPTAGSSGWGGGASSMGTAATSTAIYGGGGGGGITHDGTLGAPGTSMFGGSGGAAATTTNGTDGTAPGGGGGATRTGTSSGKGARGEVRIWGVA